MLFGVLAHRAAQVELGRQPLHAGREPGVGLAAAGGVERADERRRLEEHGRLGRAGAQRLVQVHDVEGLVAQRPDRAQLGREVRRDRRHRPVGRRRHAVAERRHARVGRRSVARTEDPHVVARGPQRPRQPQDLALHAARQRQAVGADDADAHRPTVVRGRNPHPRTGSGGDAPGHRNQNQFERAQRLQSRSRTGPVRVATSMGWTVAAVDTSDQGVAVDDGEATSPTRPWP